ncbi:FadR/GntR family transcriptional regulator [Oceaniglobus trochenteri]|uniref:FadR/GntR family transcriptional regulator n=1 Tax=Oceaniglobus trochenteri TaxID=2763260 RepID=UPI001CFF71F9
MTTDNRRSDAVYDALLGEVSADRLAVGTRLPSEAAIAAAHGVSRPVVREALSRLRDDGIIRSRKGSGSYVEQKPGARLDAISPLASIADVQRCFEYRITLEPEAAALAALRRGAGDLAALRRALAALDRANSEKATGAEEDFAFHRMIGAASRNRFLVAGLDQIRTHIAQGMNINRTLSLSSIGPRMALAQSEHRAILDAIAAQAPEEARAAMRAHLQNAKSRVFED